ncbi:hypothetical protein [Lichenibacterium dinghuense]|uniref:hypothetical protein n=1 Tax=Lichenibacterium dinghuense TaxID=2895977 RepID=UPI001F2E5AEE|nr:hypothetical protein [Lichenibacterium sp. 6Y81]
MTRVGARAFALCWAGLALGSALGGCAATEKLTSSASGVGSSFGNLLAFGTTTPGPAPAPAGAAERPLQCPTIEVLDGTASYRTYAGADQTNENVRYQFSMGDVARECTHSGKDLLIKVGVEGRVLLGPAGSPGSFTVPVRIAVRHDGDGKVAAAKFFQVPATIASGEDATGFQVVSDPIAVPFVTSSADDDYTILVGFDAGTKPTAAASDGKKARRHGAKPRDASAAPQG